MKILKIEQENIDGDKIVVTVEGYEHAQPVFDANITKTELEIALKAWKTNQDEVDAINEENKIAPPPVKPDISDLKTLEGKELIDKIVVK